MRKKLVRALKLGGKYAAYAFLAIACWAAVYNAVRTRQLAELFLSPPTQAQPDEADTAKAVLTDICLKRRPR